MKKHKNAGFVKLIVLIVVAILVLSYYNISIKDVVDSPAGQGNINYVKDFLITAWNFIKGFIGS